MKQKTYNSISVLQEHFDIRDEDLEDTLEEFEKAAETKSKSKLNFATVSGLVFVFIAAFSVFGAITGSSSSITYDTLSLFIVLGSVMVILLGVGLGGFKQRAPKKSKKRQKSSSFKKNTSSANHFSREASTTGEAYSGLDEYGLKKKKRFFRSTQNSMVFGVCGGIAEYFNIDPTIVRIAFAILALYYGSSVLLYILLAIFIPKDTE